jgi:23S rRNA (adenine2503-C2)-methyltransferase
MSDPRLGLSFPAFARALPRSATPEELRGAWAALHAGTAMAGQKNLPPQPAPDLPEVIAEHVSTDGLARKLVLRLGDGTRIESVLMEYRGRFTGCISSQVGCAMGCVFCATGQGGFLRHLSTAEIVAQVVVLNRRLRDLRGERLRNLVLMGMGEPLHNYEAVLAATEILSDQRGSAIAGRRITLSTVGIVPGILRLAEERRPVHLAVSLHGATDAARNALVPVGRRWPLAELIEACKTYARKRRRKVLFEWTLIADETDTPTQANAVGRLLSEVPCQLNVIPLNPTAGYAGRASSAEAIARFREIVEGHGIPTSVRQRRGIEVAGGCGQLAGSV